MSLTDIHRGRSAWRQSSCVGNPPFNLSRPLATQLVLENGSDSVFHDERGRNQSPGTCKERLTSPARVDPRSTTPILGMSTSLEATLPPTDSVIKGTQRCSDTQLLSRHTAATHHRGSTAQNAGRRLTGVRCVPLVFLPLAASQALFE